MQLMVVTSLSIMYVRVYLRHRRDMRTIYQKNAACIIQTHHFKSSKPAPTPPLPSNPMSSKKSVSGKDLDLMKKRAGKGGPLPTKKNRMATEPSKGSKTSERVESQHLHYPCFTMFARHQTAELFVYNTDVVKQVISTFQAGRHTSKDRIAEKNAAVESWWASNRKSDKPLSTSILTKTLVKMVFPLNRPMMWR